MAALSPAGDTPVPAPPFGTWQTLQAEALACQAAASWARADLEARIGQRGLTVGTLTLPDGRGAPIQIASAEGLKRYWRRLPHHLQQAFHGDYAALQGAMRAACERWDAEAERCGLRELERRAESARAKAKAAVAQHVRALAERRPVLSGGG